MEWLPQQFAFLHLHLVAEGIPGRFSRLRHSLLLALIDPICFNCGTPFDLHFDLTFSAHALFRIDVARVLFGLQPVGA